ncbi:MAG: hypothetical protein JO210_20485 [Acidobacteriaceae bacterium]|nr:hypothetical protein [Acidobacteriaceae bacterium]
MSPVRGTIAALLLAIFFCNAVGKTQENDQPLRLLLTPRLLRRLQRDRARQTIRWQNFEKRVQTVPDSPERGFELALYYAVTHDQQRGNEAVDWAVGHKCDGRQVALVLDWADELVSADQKRTLAQANCVLVVTPPPPALRLRDNLFKAIALSDVKQDQLGFSSKHLLDDLKGSGPINSNALYATVEYIMATRTLTRTDIRESDPHFFSLLPKEFLLSLKPDQVEHPNWMAHIAALALVTLDPNLENAQFLQGWAMEDRQMLREGPGVAYEFLWADPYLPGVAYQNMDPWIYDPAGRLFARSDWESDACWVSIFPQSHNEQNCGNGATQFGSLTLSTLTDSCITIPVRQNKETTILRNLKPRAQLTYEHDRQHSREQADPAGLWPVPNDTVGKVCLESQGRH